MQQNATQTYYDRAGNPTAEMTYERDAGGRVTSVSGRGIRTMPVSEGAPAQQSQYEPPPMPKAPLLPSFSGPMRMEYPGDGAISRDAGVPMSPQRERQHYSYLQHAANMQSMKLASDERQAAMGAMANMYGQQLNYLRGAQPEPYKPGAGLMQVGSDNSIYDANSGKWLTPPQRAADQWQPFAPGGAVQPGVYVRGDRVVDLNRVDPITGQLVSPGSPASSAGVPPAAASAQPRTLEEARNAATAAGQKSFQFNGKTYRLRE